VEEIIFEISKTLEIFQNFELMINHK